MFLTTVGLEAKYYYYYHNYNYYYFIIIITIKKVILLQLKTICTWLLMKDLWVFFKFSPEIICWFQKATYFQSPKNLLHSIKEILASQESLCWSLLGKNQNKTNDNQVHTCSFRLPAYQVLLESFNVFVNIHLWEKQIMFLSK